MSTTKKGVFALIILAGVFATMGVFARYLDQNLQLFEQTYLRIFLALIIGIILFYSKIEFNKFLQLPKTDLFVLILRSICLYLAVILVTKAFLIEKFSNVSFIAAIPILPLIGYFLLKEKISKQIFLYILFGFFGVALISFQNFDSFTLGLGALLALLSALFFDISYIARKYHSNYLNNYESTVFMFFIGFIFLFISSILAGESLPSISNFNLNILFVLSIAGIFNVINLYLTNYGFEHVKVSIAGNLLTLEVFFALGYGLLLYGEILTFIEVIGSAIILVSVYLVNFEENRTSKS